MTQNKTNIVEMILQKTVETDGIITELNRQKTEQGRSISQLRQKLRTVFSKKWPRLKIIARS